VWLLCYNERTLLECVESEPNLITNVITKPVYALADSLGIAGFFMEFEMKNLVKKNNDAFVVGTSDLWNGFGYNEHRFLRRVVSKHLEQFESRGEIVLASVEAGTFTGNQKPEAEYLLNERQFILLCLLVKNTPASVKIKCGIESEFALLRSEVARLSQADEKMLRLTRINPNTLKAITGERSNNAVRENYKALIEAGLLEAHTKIIFKRVYLPTIKGLEYVKTSHHDIVRFKPKYHDLIIEAVNEFKSQLSCDNVDLFLE
jgi:hypothetical protein